jgi:RNA polymerase sigma-70 factor (ECF subfamily)
MPWITTTQILHQLKQEDVPQAWEALCNHFQPIIIHFGRELGLTTEQAEDAAQETLMTFVKALRKGRYDREKGRLSAWLFGIAQRVIRNARTQAGRASGLQAQPAPGQGGLSDEQALKLTWETQWQRIVLSRCLQRVRHEIDPTVYEAFRLYALLDTPPEQVAKHLDISRNAVYIAKTRVLSRLRTYISQLEEIEATSHHDLSGS